MPLIHLIEPDLLAGSWMNRKARPDLIRAQAAVLIPFELDRTFATVCFDGRAVRSFEDALPRQSRPAISMKPPDVSDPFAFELFDDLRIEQPENLSAISDGGLASASWSDIAIEQKAAR